MFLNNCQTISLKWLALVTMLIDHIGAVFSPYFPDLLILRCIGRFAFPAFAFLMVMNLTRRPLDNRRLLEYIVWLTGFGILAQYPFKMLFDTERLNVYFQFVGTILCVFAYERRNDSFRVIIISLGVVGIMLSSISDYGISGLIYSLVAYIFVKSAVATPRQYSHVFCFLLTVFALLCNDYFISYYWGTLLSPVFILSIVATMYFILSPNGLSAVKFSEKNSRQKPTRRQKIFFYAFYPVHLALLLEIDKLVIL